MEEALAIIADLAYRLLLDIEDRAAAGRYAIAAQSGGAAGFEALLALARLVGEAADANELALMVDRSVAESVPARLALFVADCFSAARRDYPTRQDAIAARTRIAAKADGLYPLLSPAGADAVAFVARLAGQVVMSLSAVAASRASLVRVETGLSLSSAFMAWELYGDPQRAGELVRRNRVATPMLMPAAFEALAS